MAGCFPSADKAPGRTQYSCHSSASLSVQHYNPLVETCSYRHAGASELLLGDFQPDSDVTAPYSCELMHFYY